MRRQFELALQLGPRQPERLELANAFGIAALRNLACFLLFVFPFFQALGETGFRVDESFSGVTHNLIIRIGCPLFTTLPGQDGTVSHAAVTRT